MTDSYFWRAGPIRISGTPQGWSALRSAMSNLCKYFQLERRWTRKAAQSHSAALRECNQEPDILVLLFKVCISTKYCCLLYAFKRTMLLLCSGCVFVIFRFDWPQVSFLVDLLRYITRFQWDKAKYPTTNPLSSLKDLINKVWENMPCVCYYRYICTFPQTGDWEIKTTGCVRMFCRWQKS